MAPKWLPVLRAAMRVGHNPLSSIGFLVSTNLPELKKAISCPARFLFFCDPMLGQVRGFETYDSALWYGLSVAVIPFPRPQGLQRRSGFASILTAEGALSVKWRFASPKQGCDAGRLGHRKASETKDVRPITA